MYIHTHVNENFTKIQFKFTHAYKYNIKYNRFVHICSKISVLNDSVLQQYSFSPSSIILYICMQY